MFYNFKVIIFVMSLKQTLKISIMKAQKLITTVAIVLGVLFFGWVLITCLPHSVNEFHLDIK